MKNDVYIYKNFNLIDVETGSIQTNLSLIVSNGRVKDLTSRSGVGEVISLNGGFVVPGLIDAHVHLVWEGQPDPNRYTLSESIPVTAYRAARSAWRNLRGGVTTVRDMGGPHGINVALSAAVAGGQVQGSRILAAGAPICQTGGHVHTMGREADGVQDVRKAVREQIKTGAHLIKLMCSGGAYTQGESIHATQLTPDEILTAVEESHIAERKVAAHALPQQAIQNCLEAGVDTIEHSALLNDQNIATFKQTGSFMIPTIAPYHMMAIKGVDLGVPGYAIQKSQMVMDHYFSSLKTALQTGINVGMGTDSGSPTLLHPTIPYEAWLWQTLAGIDTLTILRSTTRANAAALGKGQELGLLKFGYWADFVVYESNPLEDISVLHFPSAVYKGGEKVAADSPVWSSTLIDI